MFLTYINMIKDVLMEVLKPDLVSSHQRLLNVSKQERVKQIDYWINYWYRRAAVVTAAHEWALLFLGTAELVHVALITETEIT